MMISPPFVNEKKSLGMFLRLSTQDQGCEILSGNVPNYSDSIQLCSEYYHKS